MGVHLSIQIYHGNKQFKEYEKLVRHFPYCTPGFKMDVCPFKSTSGLDVSVHKLCVCYV